MKQVIAKIVAWVMSYQTLPTAAEQVEAVLSTFTGMVEKLDAAIAQADDEISATWDRLDEAYNVFRAIDDREDDVRSTSTAAKYSAEAARDRIAALVGGAA